jgi:uncharacterized protein YdhG (YjbR/CyaY superfamily)
MNKNMKVAKTVAEYIGMFPSPVATRLKTMRKIARETATKAEEKISYGMIGYKLNGKALVYLGGFAKHVSLFALPSGTAAFKKELVKYKTSKGTIQFPLDAPLPIGLIRKIVRYRVKENS